MARPFIPLYNGARVALVMNVIGTNYVFVNVLHFLCVDGFTLANLQVLVDSLAQYDLGYYRNLRSTVIYLNQIQARALDTEASPSWEVFYGTSHPGTYGGSLYSFAGTKAAHLLTTARGRGAQGRLFVPPLTAAALATGNTITTAFASQILNNLGPLIAWVQANDPPMKWVVASYRHNHAWRLEAVPFDVANVVLSGTRIDTLRERLTQVH